MKKQLKICQKCGQVFSSQNRLAQHVQVNHDLDRIVSKLNLLFAKEDLAFHKRLAKREIAGVR